MPMPKVMGGTPQPWPGQESSIMGGPHISIIPDQITGKAEPVPPTAMPSDVYLVKLERLLVESAKVRAVLGECLGFFRAMPVDDSVLAGDINAMMERIEAVLK